MFELKSDYQQTRDRMEAFWNNDVLDRPIVTFYLAKPLSEQIPLPQSGHKTARERWMDSDFQAEAALISLKNRLFLGDSLPIAFPNLGPEVFSAFYGCPLHFGDFGTSWTDPILFDWQDAEKLAIDWHHPYLLKLLEMTDRLIDVSAGTFIVGMPDWHPGGDCIAAFRDPQDFAMDLITHKPEVIRLLDRVAEDYYKIYDLFYNRLKAAGMPATSWTPLVSDGKYYIPSNDFSIMISKAMYDEIFLPGITAECNFLDRSIYHLDGPGALRHLDSILAIPRLNALQWVFGAGNEGYHRWISVYQKVQAAQKGIQVTCHVSELEQVMQTLSPKGLYLALDGIEDSEMANTLLKKLTHWTSAFRASHPA